jgi:hypothetical protein
MPSAAFLRSMGAASVLAGVVLLVLALVRGRLR